MIDKATAIPTIIRKLKKLPIGHAIDLRTYKRNRSVVFARIDEEQFEVVENGFHVEQFIVTMDKMKKLLKLLLKREFPRSTKMRLYDLGESEADVHIARKKI